ncbi:MAG: GNAT family N-acetyltransferase [Lentimicrobium sp.]|nr:GNAT family N-acetyltransferase [Lentimicrobium sp.]
MDIKLEETGKSGSFYIGKYENKAAEINWKTHDGYIEVYETRVNDSLKGHGYGIKLFNRVVEYAQEHSLKIKPVCSFVAKMFERHPELQDLKVE